MCYGPMSVRLSLASRFSIISAKHIVTQTTIAQGLQFTDATPHTGAPNARGMGKNAFFNQSISGFDLWNFWCRWRMR